MLTPESSVRAQKALGADIIIPLDELPPHHISRERLTRSVRLSHRWMARSLREHLREPRQQAMYAVIHGGTDEELRAESAEYLASLPYDGFAIGGSLGADRSEMLKLLEFLVPRLPADKPNHLLGIADPESAEAVAPLGQRAAKLSLQVGAAPPRAPSGPTPMRPWPPASASRPAPCT